jgi:SulP family sulfate permease
MDKPRLIEVLQKGYSLKTFGADLSAGLIVGVVAIPLAVAFAIASGVTPDKGLLTAVIAGFLISALGGSNMQIGGPTGAFIVIVYGVLTKYGPEGLIVATLMAGVFLLILGFAKLGTVIQFIPYPVIVGFTAGIAVTILTSQVNDFLGLGLTHIPADFLDKWGLFLTHLDQTNFWALGLAVGTIVVIVGVKRINGQIPAALVALVLGTVAVLVFRLPVETIGSRFGAISGAIPVPTLPNVGLDHLRSLILPAFSIAMLAGIESLLSAVVADTQTGTKHNSNQELIGQGFANVASALFGGIPATGAIARTATNIKSGGQTPVAGIVHAVFLLLVLLFLSPLTGLIPLAVLAGILATVCYNMSEHTTFVELTKGPPADMVVLVATFLLTVLIDLTVAIPVGILFALLFFLRKMSRSTQVTRHSGELRDAPEELDPFGLTKVTLPDEVEVFEVEGPFFFGAAERFKEALKFDDQAGRVRVLRFRRVPSIDASGVRVLKELVANARAHGTALLFASVSGDVMATLKRSGFVALAGADAFLPDLLAALDRALTLLGHGEPSLADRLVRGGSVTATSTAAATDPVAFLRAVSASFPLAPAAREALARSMVEREAMASTALGRGVAFPHPRNPLAGVHDQEFVTVAYPAEPLDWGAPDGQPVKAVFFLAATSVQNHLKTLATLAKHTKDPDFQALLDRRADAGELAAWIRGRP